MEKNFFQIAGLAAREGERINGWIPIPKGEPLPVTVICGRLPGAAVLITAGIHSTEFTGIQAALELAEELKPESLAGSVVVIPVVNRSGFTRHQQSAVYDDGKNLNRVFPGSEDGTLAERIAWVLTEQFHQRVDFYIDLHGGDLCEEMSPYILCAGNCARETARYSRNMALQADMPYYVVSQVCGEGSYNVAAALGVPSVLLERGGCGCWRREEVEADKKDVRNILRYLKVLDSPPEAREFVPRGVEHARYEVCTQTGFWYPEKRAGDRFRAGELLGTVRGWAGEPLQAVRARGNGVLLYQLAGLNAVKGTILTACGILPEGE